jgi:hypothetical protein
LSIFHNVVAALAAFCASTFVFHVIMGINMLSGDFGPSNDFKPPPSFAWMMILFPGGMILAGWVFAVCLAVAGQNLVQLKNYRFCFVMAALACLFTPFGTVLGVFTIIALTRPRVRELFGVPAPGSVDAS